MELLEWLCGHTRDWSIRLYGQGIDAIVTVAGGQIIDARWGNVHGMEALAEIVGCQHGSFELVPVTGPPRRSLYGQWQTLLHSALQARDTRNHGTQVDRSQPELHTPELLITGLSPQA